MRLHDRLEEILGKGEKRVPLEDIVPIDKAVPGQIVKNEYGFYYRAESEFPLKHCYGHHSLRSAAKVDPVGVCIAGKDDRFHSFDPTDCVFLDTETTGLAGGSGTYAFLVGVGMYEGTKFVVRQLFMRDYNEESSLLGALTDLVKGRKFIVTYNGKTFDVPLIESRFLMSRMASALRGMEHLDLLHATRRVWGKRLTDCRLETVEKNILGFRRAGDIPGEEIPDIYFSYLVDHDASVLPIVFEHNRNDVLCLAVLLKELCSVVRDTEHERLKALDLYSIARVYDSMKRRDETLPFYRKAVKGLRGSERAAAGYLMGVACKRLGKWDEAVTAWKGALGRDLYEPYEELAKYYEHVGKNLVKARTVVEEALRAFRKTKYEKPLMHRLSRINRKLKAGGMY